MYWSKFIDGTPVPKDYPELLGIALNATLDAEEYFTLDELEEFARKDRSLYAVQGSQTDSGPDSAGPMLSPVPRSYVRVPKL